MPLPLPLSVPGAYYYYYYYYFHHQHQHLLHFSSYLSSNSCPAMPKCGAGTRIRPRVCNHTALSKARACGGLSQPPPPPPVAGPASLHSTSTDSRGQARSPEQHAAGSGSLAADLNWTEVLLVGKGGDEWRSLTLGVATRRLGEAALSCRASPPKGVLSTNCNSESSVRHFGSTCVARVGQRHRRGRFSKQTPIASCTFLRDRRYGIKDLDSNGGKSQRASDERGTVFFPG